MISTQKKVLRKKNMTMIEQEEALVDHYTWLAMSDKWKLETNTHTVQKWPERSDLPPLQLKSG